MRIVDPRLWLSLALFAATPAQAQDEDDDDPETPPLPEGMTLEEVLEQAALGPPPEGVRPIPDQKIYAFWLFDQLEGRVTPSGDAHLGWKDLGWVGADVDRLWWKNEGEWFPAEDLAGAMETDLLYGRLVAPFWTALAGVRYANEWSAQGYEDTWAAAIAMQGLVPYKIELEASVYFSEDLHLTSQIEVEYGLRITQRLVLQPRVEVSLSAQDVPERNVGWGLTHTDLDLRVRYELRRELAPYLGLRGALDVGRTARFVREDGGTPVTFLLIGGVRLAI